MAGTRERVLVQELLEKQSQDTCFVLRVLDYEESHKTWHRFLARPLQVSDEGSKSGFYVMLGGTFGSQEEYVPLTRLGRQDCFFTKPRCKNAVLSIDAISKRKSDSESKVATYSSFCNTLLACNSNHESADL